MSISAVQRFSYLLIIDRPRRASGASLCDGRVQLDSKPVVRLLLLLLMVICLLGAAVAFDLCAAAVRAVRVAPDGTVESVVPLSVRVHVSGAVLRPDDSCSQVSQSENKQSYKQERLTGLAPRIAGRPTHF